MTNWKYKILTLCKRILLLMMVLFLSRLFYILINIESAGYSGFNDIITILFYGFRFDYTAIIYFNSLFIVLSILPFDFSFSHWYNRSLKYFFIITNSILLLLDLGDAIYYQFSNKRTTFDIFQIGGFGNDFLNLLPSYIIDFWYVFIVWLILIFLLVFLYPGKRPIKKDINTHSNKRAFHQIKNLLIYFLIITILYIPARGIGLKPVRIITAASYVSTDYIPFVLNTPFTLITTFQKEDIPELNYYPEEEINKILELQKQYSDTSGFNKQNIVILILESFGKEYIGYYNEYDGYTPFLDSLIENSLHCTNAYANGSKSIDALPAVLAGIPSLMTTPYITSQYASNKINGIGKILSEKGYHTSFFHGGVNGTMGFDHFSHLAGFENYYGLNEYPDESDFDGKWGIFDEEFYSFFNNELSEFEQPFISCFFSLSSHHPYIIPDKYEGNFTEGSLDIHRSIKYADYALKTFFESAKEEDWFNNTLFIITADHTSKSDVRKYQNSVGAYSIPLILYKPDDINMKGSISHVVSQKDIMASVLDYINYDEPIITFGNSIFKSTPDNFSIVKHSSIYQTFNNDTTIIFNGSDFTSLYAYKTDSMLRNNLIKSGIKINSKIEQSIKAYIQEYNFRIKNNSLTTLD